jgi:small subunit ribosomal protein S6
VNTTNRIYESLYIVDATLNDDQVESIVSKYAKVITDQGGEMQAAGKWDKRRLAYEVNGRREGTYILMYFNGEPAVAEELDRLFRIADDVFRHIIVRVEAQYVDTTRIDHPQPAAEPRAEAPAQEVTAEQAEPAEQVEAAEAPAQEEAVAEAPAEQPAEEPVAEPAEEAAAEPVEEAAAEPAEEPAEEAAEAPAEPEQAEEPVSAEEPEAAEASEETKSEETNEPEKEQE